ncbi:Multiple inositol polyphosphate phosphatase 1 [Eumeta japonica]|uniref:Multiple inositol polyphosphate phosphatase 1 n=1 Tax=Eumeta variegata TaxID=151549 RepID=A0A4C1U0V5_EUMVA|nr:Multiple inositol polyphosphate phosphatase 1 [Eumeta japonica]
MLARHGARIPEASEIIDLRTLDSFKKNIIDNYKSGNYRNNDLRMCPADVNILDGWKWNLMHNATSAGSPTSDGYLTTQRIAQAYRQRYPDLFTFNAYDYSFELPSSQVWQGTYQAFTEGLFRQSADNLNFPKTNNDTLFKAHETCPVWIRDVKENNATLTQYEMFKSSKGYRDMIANISQRLGFNYNIESKFVDLMYEMCRYNTAWDTTQISPWCAAFTTEDLKRLEYAEDLKTYYTQGYGSYLNQKVACPLITNMMKFFKDIVQDPTKAGEFTLDIPNFHKLDTDVESCNNTKSSFTPCTPKQPRVMIRFTDDPMYLMALSALGAHRDGTPLTADGYNTPQAINRKWMTSTIDPFNANVAAVLYRCNPVNPENQFKVLFLENEYPMTLDECRVGLCDWSVMSRRYGGISETCDMQFCNGAGAVNGYVGLCIALAAFFMGITGL